MERDYELQNDILVADRDIETRSSSIRRRRRETGANASAPQGVQTSIFSNNYNPVDIEELAKKIEAERYTKTETEVKQTKEQAAQEFIKITKLAKAKTQTLVTTEEETADELEADIVAADNFFSNIKINFRGKLIMGVVAVALVCLMVLTIYNVVALANVNGRLSDVNAQITVEQRYVDLAESFSEYLQSLGDSTNPSTPVNYNPVNVTGGGTATADTNWFDSIVTFFQNLFGWN